jgi:hypothetical protein
MTVINNSSKNLLESWVCFGIEKNLAEEDDLLCNWKESSGRWFEKNLLEDDLKRIYWKIIDFGMEKNIKHTIFKQ